MKLIIPQKTLVEALKRGAYASLSDEAQSDNSTLSSLVKSIKIKASFDKITFESATALIASQYSEPVVEKTKVEEEGVAMVPAKELFEWVDGQGDCVIKLSLKKLDEPKSINYATGEIDGGSTASIKMTGKLKLASQDKSKTGSKWSLDSYDEQQVPQIDYAREEAPLFVAPLENISNGLKNISFVAMPKDTDHLFDTISFQHKNEDLYMITSDCTRCATWYVPNADKISLKETMKAETAQDMEGSWEHNVLISTKVLGDICKMSSGASPLEVYRDANKNRVYISQPGFVVRMATAEKEAVDGFPPLDVFLRKKFDDLCSVDAKVLSNRLKTVSLVNKVSVLFDFVNSDDQKLILHGISETGHSPCKATVGASNLQKDFKQVWNVQHFIDILKATNSNEIKIMAPSNGAKNSIKVLNPDAPNASYYIMAIERHKYNMD